MWDCSVASWPMSAGAITSLTFLTAFNTPLPRKRFLSPSRNSSASCSPVDAPDGTIDRPRTPLSSWQSTSTVGLPRESNTSLALIVWIFISVGQYDPRRRPIGILQIQRQGEHGVVAGRHGVQI